MRSLYLRQNVNTESIDWRQMNRRSKSRSGAKRKQIPATKNAPQKTTAETLVPMSLVSRPFEEIVLAGSNSKGTKTNKSIIPTNAQVKPKKR